MSRILQDQHPQRQNLYHALGSGEERKAKKKKENVHKTKLKGVRIKSKQKGAEF